MIIIDFYKKLVKNIIISCVKIFAGKVRIALRYRHGGVPREFLSDFQVPRRVQDVCHKVMTEGMRRDGSHGFLAKTFEHPLVDDFPACFSRDGKDFLSCAFI